MDRSAYVKLYLLAERAVGNESLVPHLQNEEISELVSKENWLLVPNRHFGSREKVKESPFPNVWLSLPKEGGINIGIIYDNSKAVANAGEVLHAFNDENRLKLLDALRGLDDRWQTGVMKRIKRNHNLSPTEHLDLDPPFELNSNSMDGDGIAQLFKKVNDILGENEHLKGLPKDERQKILWIAPSIILMEVHIDNDEREFEKRIKEVFGVYEICSNIKETSEYERQELLRTLEEFDRTNKPEWRWYYDNGGSWIEDLHSKLIKQNIALLKIPKGSFRHLLATAYKNQLGENR